MNYYKIENKEMKQQPDTQKQDFASPNRTSDTSAVKHLLFLPTHPFR